MDMTEYSRSQDIPAPSDQVGNTPPDCPSDCQTDCPSGRQTGHQSDRPTDRSEPASRVFSHALMLTISQCSIVLGFLLPRLIVDLHLTLQQAGTLFLFTFSAYMLFVLVSGRLALRVGLLPLLRLSAAAITGAVLLAAFSNGFAGLAAALFLLGGFSGVQESLGSTYGVAVSRQQPPQALNGLQISFGLGAAICAPIAALIEMAGGTWRTMYVYLAVFAAGAFLLSLLAAEPRHAAAQADRSTASVSPPSAAAVDSNGTVAVSAAKPDRRLRAYSRQTRWILAALGLMLFLYCSAEGSLNGWLATFLQEAQSFSRLTNALLMSCYWIAMTVGRLLVARMLNRVAAVRLIILLPIAAALPVLPLGWIEDAWLTMLLIIAAGFLMSSIWPLLVSQGQLRADGSPAITSLLVACGGCGAGLMPYLSAWLAVALGPRLTLGFNGVLLLATGILAFLVLRNQDQEPRSPV